MPDGREMGGATGSYRDDGSKKKENQRQRTKMRQKSKDDSQWSSNVIYLEYDEAFLYTIIASSFVCVLAEKKEELSSCDISFIKGNSFSSVSFSRFASIQSH